MTLKNRVLQFIENKGLTTQNFERLCGLSNAAVSKMGDNTRRSTLDKISNAFPEININWLLTGEGSMLREPEGNATPVGNAVNAVTEQLTPVRFFEVTPTASFIEFCSGASEIPLTISVQPEHGEILDDSYCVFEIFGESMSPQIQPHAKVLCQEIPPTKWHTLADGVVAIAYSDKFVIKRILKNELASGDFIILGSDNPEYTERQPVQLSDIRAIFQAKRIISSKIF